jgi:hypothetical protein
MKPLNNKKAAGLAAAFGFFVCVFLGFSLDAEVSVPAQ